MGGCCALWGCVYCCFPVLWFQSGLRSCSNQVLAASGAHTPASADTRRQRWMPWRCHAGVSLQHGAVDHTVIRCVLSAAAGGVAAGVVSGALAVHAAWGELYLCWRASSPSLGVRMLVAGWNGAGPSAHWL